MGPSNDDDASHRLDGPWRAAVANEELRRQYPDPDFDDDGWTTVSVPHHWRSTEAFTTTDGPLLYRTHFEVPARFGAGEDEGRRTWLTLDGVLYTSDVWLDGSYLGDTEGYFFPHSFEITEAAQVPGRHTLALEVACRPETDRPAKRNLTGVLQHDDELDETWNPGGLWRPVRLEQSGPVRITHFRAVCRDATAESATIFVRAVVDTVEARPVTIETVVHRAGPSGPRQAVGGDPVVVNRTAHPLAAGENRLEWTVEVLDPDLWWPHTLGDQPLYDVHVRVRTGAPPGVSGGAVPDEAEDADDAEVAPAGPGRVSDARHRRLGLRSVAVRDWVFSINGEQLFLKGITVGPTKRELGAATDAELQRDVQLARDANLDLLRVRGHVAPDALYDAADEAGMLVWQDMPLQWGYHRSIRKQARRQARELVDLLAHHPSVAVWCGHNEPLALDVGPRTIGDREARPRLVARALVGQLLPAWNKSVLDASVKRVLERSDGSRPVVAHSGVLPHLPQLDGTDSHLWFGWHYGDATGLATALRVWPRLGRFVSELGAQAVPEDAAFLDPDRWPDLDWDRAGRRHAMQATPLRRRVPPAAHPTFAAWRDATQAHQVHVLRTHVETLRRLKYAPTGGFAVRSLADGFPAVSTAVLDVDRTPKAAYRALGDACRPVIVVADPLPTELRPGQQLALAVHVVSDARISLTDMIVTAHLWWGDPRTGTPTARSDAGPQGSSGDDSQEWRWHGDLDADSCTRIGTIAVAVPDRPGPATLELVLAPRRPDGPAPTTRPAASGEPVVPVRNRYTATVLAR